MSDSGPYLGRPTSAYTGRSTTLVTRESATQPVGSKLEPYVEEEDEKKKKLKEEKKRIQELYAEPVMEAQASIEKEAPQDPKRVVVGISGYKVPRLYDFFEAPTLTTPEPETDVWARMEVYKMGRAPSSSIATKYGPAQAWFNQQRGVLQENAKKMGDALTIAHLKFNVAMEEFMKHEWEIEMIAQEKEQREAAEKAAKFDANVRALNALWDMGYTPESLGITDTTAFAESGAALDLYYQKNPFAAPDTSNYTKAQQDDLIKTWNENYAPATGQPKVKNWEEYVLVTRAAKVQSGAATGNMTVPASVLADASIILGDRQKIDIAQAIANAPTYTDVYLVGQPKQDIITERMKNPIMDKYKGYEGYIRVKKSGGLDTSYADERIRLDKSAGTYEQKHTAGVRSDTNVVKDTVAQVLSQSMSPVISYIDTGFSAIGMTERKPSGGTINFPISGQLKRLAAINKQLSTYENEMVYPEGETTVANTLILTIRELENKISPYNQYVDDNIWYGSEEKYNEYSSLVDQINTAVEQYNKYQIVDEYGSYFTGTPTEYEDYKELVMQKTNIYENLGLLGSSTTRPLTESEKESYIIRGLEPPPTVTFPSKTPYDFGRLATFVFGEEREQLVTSLEKGDISSPVIIKAQEYKEASPLEQGGYLGSIVGIFSGVSGEVSNWFTKESIEGSARDIYKVNRIHAPDQFAWMEGVADKYDVEFDITDRFPLSVGGWSLEQPLPFVPIILPWHESLTDAITDPSTPTGQLIKMHENQFPHIPSQKEMWGYELGSPMSMIRPVRGTLLGLIGGAGFLPTVGSQISTIWGRASVEGPLDVGPSVVYTTGDIATAMGNALVTDPASAIPEFYVMGKVIHAQTSLFPIKFTFGRLPSGEEITVKRPAIFKEYVDYTTESGISTGEKSSVYRVGLEDVQVPKLRAFPYIYYMSPFASLRVLTEKGAPYEVTPLLGIGYEGSATNTVGSLLLRGKYEVKSMFGVRDIDINYLAGVAGFPATRFVEQPPPRISPIDVIKAASPFRKLDVSLSRGGPEFVDAFGQTAKVERNYRYSGWVYESPAARLMRESGRSGGYTGIIPLFGKERYDITISGLWSGNILKTDILANRYTLGTPREAYDVLVGNERYARPFREGQIILPVVRGIDKGESGILERRTELMRMLYEEPTWFVRDPYKEIENVYTVPKGYGAEIFDTIKSDATHEFGGSFALSLTSSTSIRGFDLDVATEYVTEMYNKLNPIYERAYGKENVRLGEDFGEKYKVIQVNIKGEWMDAVDIHSTEHLFGWQEFGFKSKAPVRIKGGNIMPYGEGWARKSFSMSQIKVEMKEGVPSVDIYPKMKRSKDYAHLLTELKILSPKYDVYIRDLERMMESPSVTEEYRAGAMEKISMLKTKRATTDVYTYNPITGEYDIQVKAEISPVTGKISITRGDYIIGGRKSVKPKIAKFRITTKLAEDWAESVKRGIKTPIGAGGVGDYYTPDIGIEFTLPALEKALQKQAGPLQTSPSLQQLDNVKSAVRASYKHRAEVINPPEVALKYLDWMPKDEQAIADFIDIQRRNTVRFKGSVTNLIFGEQGPKMGDLELYVPPSRMGQWKTDMKVWSDKWRGEGRIQISEEGKIKFKITPTDIRKVPIPVEKYTEVTGGAGKVITETEVPEKTIDVGIADSDVWIKAIDTHLKEPSGAYIGRYGIKAPQPAIIDGVEYMGPEEQALRSSTQMGMVHKTSEGQLVLSTELWRGKTYTDIKYLFKGTKSEELGAKIVEDINKNDIVINALKSFNRKYITPSVDKTQYPRYKRIPFTNRFVSVRSFESGQFPAPSGKYDDLVITGGGIESEYEPYVYRKSGMFDTFKPYYSYRDVDEYTIGYMTRLYAKSYVPSVYKPSYQTSYTTTYTPSYTPTYKPSYRPSYKPPYTPTYTPSYKPPYTPTYKPQYTPPYKPSYKPPYNPPYTPTYKPPYTPPYKPPYNPPYTPVIPPYYHYRVPPPPPFLEKNLEEITRKPIRQSMFHHKELLHWGIPTPKQVWYGIKSKPKYAPHKRTYPVEVFGYKAGLYTPRVANNIKRMFKRQKRKGPKR